MSYVTLRRVLSTSWRAAGRLAAIWRQMDAPREKREAFGELVGIDTATLSAINSGSRPLTPEMAQRIIDRARPLFPAISLLDLGAPEAEAADPETRAAVDRLRSLGAEHAELRRQFDAFVEATTARLARLEAAPAKRAQQ